MSISKKDTMNTKIVKIINYNGEPVTGIKEMFLVDADYIKIVDSERNMLNTLYQPVFIIKDGEYIHLNKSTIPTRSDALTLMNVAPAIGYKYPELYKLNLITGDNPEEIGQGVYKLRYNFTGGPAKLVRLFMGQTDISGTVVDVYERSNFQNVVLIDYDELDYMYQINKGIKMDVANHKLFFNFDDGEGDFEIKIDKVPNIPNTVVSETLKATAYIPTANIPENKEFDNKAALMMRKNKLINAKKAVKDIQQKIQTYMLNNTEWSDDTEIYYKSDNTTPIVFTGEPNTDILKAHTGVGDYISGGIVTNIVYLNNKFYKVKSNNNTVTVPTNEYYSYKIGNVNESITLYIDEYYDPTTYTYITLKPILNSERDNILIKAINGDSRYYGKIVISTGIDELKLDSLLTNIPVGYNSSDVGQPNVFKAPSVISDIYYSVTTLVDDGIISNKEAILQLTPQKTYNACEDITNGVNMELNNVNNDISSYRKYDNKNYMTLDELRNVTKMELVWNEPAFIENEKIVGYQVNVKHTTSSNVGTLTSIVKNIQPANYDNLSGGLIQYINDNHAGLVSYDENYDVVVREKNIRKVTANIISLTNNRTTITVDRAIFNSNDVYYRRYIVINNNHNDRFYVKEWIGSNMVVLDKPYVGGSDTSIPMFIRDRSAKYSEDATYPTMLTLNNVDLDEHLLISIRPLTELGVYGDWSKFVKISPVNIKYKDSNRLFLAYLNEVLDISTDYTLLDEMEPNPPTLDASNIFVYNVNEVGINSNIDLNATIAMIESNMLKIDALNSKISSLQEELSSLSTDNCNNTCIVEKNRITRLITMYRIGNNDDGTFIENGITKKSLTRLLMDNVNLRESMTSNTSGTDAQYNAIIEFDESNVNSNNMIVQYMVMYEIVNSNNINPNISKKIIYGPKRPVKIFNPKTRQIGYDMDFQINKIEIPIVANVNYRIAVAAISENMLQSNWSETVSFKYTHDGTSNNSINSLIEDKVNLSLLSIQGQLSLDQQNLTDSISTVATSVSGLQNQIDSTTDAINTMNDNFVSKSNMSEMISSILRTPEFDTKLQSVVNREVALSSTTLTAP